ncbi:MAG TPA: hypothetical protein VFK13_14845 [Gemmatimonadaceae bacterium]|nr:hypothetical protein [Gemmatimonadaceae bacterium]
MRAGAVGIAAIALLLGAAIWARPDRARAGVVRGTAAGGSAVRDGDSGARLTSEVGHETGDSVRVVVRNARRDSVQVEVRAGPAEACAEKALVDVATLAPKRRWAIWADAGVCWRSERPPVGSGAWGPWHTHAGPAVVAEDAINDSV